MVLDYQREESGGGCVLSVAFSYLTQQLLLLLLHLHPSFTSLLFLHLQKLEQSVRGFLWYDPFASKSLSTKIVRICIRQYFATSSQVLQIAVKYFHFQSSGR